MKTLFVIMLYLYVMFMLALVLGAIWTIGKLWLW